MNRRSVGAVLASVAVATAFATAYQGAAGAATKTTKKAAKTTKKAAPKTTSVATTPTTGAAPATTRAVAPVTTAPAVATPAAVTDADTNASLNYGVLAPGPRSLDPHKTTSVADFDYLYPLYDRLTIIDDDLQVRPMLAASWQFSTDGKTLDFRLRRDALFQDGSPINAAAVKANIERATKEAGTATQLTIVSTVEATDDFTVRLNLKAPGGALPTSFAGPSGMIVNPKAFSRDMTNGPGDGNGSGAYRVTNVRANESAAYERVNFKYWDPSAGLLKSFTIKFTGTSVNALNGVKAGDYDLVQISGTDVVTAQADAQSRRIRITDALQLTTQNAFVLRSEKNTGAAGNKQIRQAIGYAINRNEIVGGLFNGNGRSATTYYPPNHWAHSTRAAAFYTYNPQRAKSLIEQSGISRPSIKITYSTGATVDPISVAIAQQLRDVGFDVQLDSKPAAQTLAIFQQGQTDILTASVSGITNVDPANFLAGYFLPNATSGTQAYSDADGEFRKAIEAAGNPSLTLEQKARIYEPVFVKIAEEGLMIPINNQLQVWGRTTSKDVVDKTFYRWSGLPDFRYVYVQK